MFEAACSDRIQQFDDEEESEEEEEEEEDDSSMWADKDVNLASPMDHHRSVGVVSSLMSVVTLAVSWMWA